MNLPLLYPVSPPSRRRGLKLEYLQYLLKHSQVASFAEAWIEIKEGLVNLRDAINVASFAEAWIEIYKIGVFTQNIVVASFAEAWIEICP